MEKLELIKVVEESSPNTIKMSLNNLKDIITRSELIVFIIENKTF